MPNIVEFIKKEMSDRGMTYDILAEKCECQSRTFGIS